VTGEHAGALVIRDSVTCLDGATIGGPVTVAPGASLIASSATIRGDVTVADAMAVELVGTTVEGSVDIRGTTASLILFGSTMRDNVLLANNRTGTAPTVAGNRIGATLRCESGDVRPANLGVPNTVGDAADQCTT
jgi:carbonic anhydrase/acetyltransferase-like protein (isoleucine patch superfamily)